MPELNCQLIFKSYSCLYYYFWIPFLSLSEELTQWNSHKLTMLEIFTLNLFQFP